MYIEESERVKPTQCAYKCQCRCCIIVNTKEHWRRGGSGVIGGMDLRFNQDMLVGTAESVTIVGTCGLQIVSCPNPHVCSSGHEARLQIMGRSQQHHSEIRKGRGHPFPLYLKSKVHLPAYIPMTDCSCCLLCTHMHCMYYQVTMDAHIHKHHH